MPGPTVSLSDAKTHLHKDNPADNTQLTSMLKAAESVLEQHVGPLGDRQAVQHVTSYGAIVLDTLPAASVTTITSNGATLTGTWNLAPSGVLSGLPSGRLVITYRVGWKAALGELPDDLRLAVLELTRHLWEESQRGASNRAGRTTQDGPALGGYVIPRAVEALITPYREQAV